MRRLVAIGIVLLLVAMALVVDRGLDTEPAITTEAATSVDASGVLASIGPVTLINNVYTTSFTAACVNIGALDLYFVSFSAADIGATGTITSAGASNGSASVAGGTVSVLGTTAAGTCGTAGGAAVDSISGGIAPGAHTYTVTINI